MIASQYSISHVVSAHSCTLWVLHQGLPHFIFILSLAHLHHFILIFSLAHLHAHGLAPPNLPDITEIDAEDIGPHDILTAGFPCQSFSNVGERKGLDDPRGIGMLFLEIVRVLRVNQVSAEVPPPPPHSHTRMCHHTLP